MKINHKKIKKLLPLYIDNELSKKEKDLIKEHLEECPECQTELKSYQDNYQLLSSLDEIKAPQGFYDSIKNKGGLIMKEEKKRLNIIENLKNIFSKPLQIPAGVIGLAAIVLVIGIFSTGILNNIFDNQSPDEMQEFANFYGNDSLQFKESAQPLAENMAMRSQAVNENVLHDSASPEIERKVIHRANLTIEVKNISDINSIVIKISEKNNGYIADTRDWINHNEQKFSRYQLRIPANNFNQVIAELSNKEIGYLLSRSISGQDVTEEYMDIDIRLRNLKIQQERYRELFERASEVEELLKIENELNRTRTEIERLEGRVNYLDNQISYSTITVEYREQVHLSLGTPGIIRVIRNAAQEAVNQVYRILILIGTLLPYIILAFLGYLIYKKKRNK